MSLPPGSRVGIYEVVELIGVGGMGEVYRARDSRLDRAVAIKTLPDEFSADPDRLARFEREAKVLAQLNHPHIASIYGLELGTPIALAMEMVEGETLAQRIATGPIPIDEALIIARQIADALEHAHAKGIIHRDLKPANIKAGPREAAPSVKVLDFGLAKAMDQGSGIGDQGSGRLANSPTITSPANLTRAGIVLGTAAYMSPEQARGRHVDQRADIWAFGCVLYQMLTGRRAFEGEEVADVLARVIQSEPDWTLLPAATPSNLTTLLRRCLRKDLHQRLHAIADVRIELEEIAQGATGTEPRAASTQRSPWAFTLAGLAAGAAITGALFLWFGQRPPTTAPAPLLRFTVSTPEGSTLSRGTANGRLAIAMSPDGEKLAAVLVGADSRRRVFVRRLSDTTFREVAGSEGALNVFWAPDSSRLAFTMPQGIRQADMSGGGSRQIASLAGIVNGSWSRKDVIVASSANAGPMSLWSPNATEPKPIGSIPAGVIARGLPRWLPDGESFLFVDNFGPSTGMVKRQFLSGESVDVKPFESAGLGSASLEYQSGYLLLSVREASGRIVLTAQKFDTSTSRLLGEPVMLATDINHAFSVSENALVFGDTRSSRERFQWLDARGQVSDVTNALERVTNFDLSHDERFIVFQQVNTLQLHDIGRGVTSSLASGSDPIWSPNDREIAFARLTIEGGGGGVSVMPAFGGTPRSLYVAKDPVYPEDWSRDGQWIAAVSLSEGLLIPMSGKGQPIVLAARSEGAALDEPHFSPDAKWLAYGLNRPAGNEVFLIAVPPTGERWQLSVGGGAQPRWRTDGRAVFFLSASGTITTVDVDLTAGAPPRISAPRAVVPTGVQVQPTLDQYTVSKDGRRFLLRRPADNVGTRIDELQIILNWRRLLTAGDARPRQ